MGHRLRLKASFDVSGYPRQARIVLVALKRYGMLDADNGSSWYITGAMQPALVERPAAYGIALLVGGRPDFEALRHPSAPQLLDLPNDVERTSTGAGAANSDAIIRSIGPDDTLHPDFGSGLWEGAPIGIPITVVRRRQAKTRVRFEYADESDRGPYPIPRNVKIEGGRQSDGDRHAQIHEGSCAALYELFALYPKGKRLASPGSWTRSAPPHYRAASIGTAGCTSRPTPPASPSSPARFDEVARGRIDHALRFTVSQGRGARRSTPLATTREGSTVRQGTVVITQRDQRS